MRVISNKIECIPKGLFPILMGSEGLIPLVVVLSVGVGVVSAVSYMKRFKEIKKDLTNIVYNNSGDNHMIGHYAIRGVALCDLEGNITLTMTWHFTGNILKNVSCDVIELNHPQHVLS